MFMTSELSHWKMHMYALGALQAINPSTAHQALFTLTVTFDANNRTTTAAEAEGLIGIFQRYSLCHGRTFKLHWKQ